MTESRIAHGFSPVLSRRVGWFALLCAAAALALTIAGGATGASVRWTAWALPILIATNVAVLFFGWLARRPLLLRSYFFVSLGLAGAILTSELLVLLRH